MLDAFNMYSTCVKRLELAIHKLSSVMIVLGCVIELNLVKPIYWAQEMYFIIQAVRNQTGFASTTR